MIVQLTLVALIGLVLGFACGVITMGALTARRHGEIADEAASWKRKAAAVGTIAQAHGADAELIDSLLGDTGDAGDPDATQLMPVAPAGVHWRFTHHRRPDGSGCLWSHVSVIAPDLRVRPGNRRCPDECPASDVELAPPASPEVTR